jgi:putative Mg2+ transporter-C (MgtC) family protein
VDHAQVVIVVRAALAAFLGFLIGWERSVHGSPAGDRTHALVALGSSAFTTVGVVNFPETAEKLIAGVVTGIGFLGAGLIFRQEGGVVRGLTSAAGLWATASVGVVIGIGEPLAGLALTAMVLLLLAWDRIPFVSQIGPRGRRTRRAGIETSESNEA